MKRCNWIEYCVHRVSAIYLAEGQYCVHRVNAIYLAEGESQLSSDVKFLRNGTQGSFELVKIKYQQEIYQGLDSIQSHTRRSLR